MMKTITAAAAVAAPIALAQGADTLPAAELLHVSRSGTLHVEAPPQRAFMLFTGPGEKLWIEDWDPVVVSGDGLSRGTVFVTDIDEQTLWIIVDFDREARRARYARFAPGSRAGTVEVSVESDGEGGAIAHIAYELTALTAAGNKILEAFDDAAYTEMLRTWEQMIRNADIDYEAALFAGH